jgi:large conductance mechanosensitive channel
VKRFNILHGIIGDFAWKLCPSHLEFRAYNLLIIKREGAMWKEFKDFAVKGNVLDMAVGIIIGAAFGTIVQSLVKDVIMPPIGMLLGNVDFANLFIVLKDGAVAGPYASVEAAQSVGAVTINYGIFFNALISFFIVAFAVFMIVKSFSKMKRVDKAPPPSEPTVKNCPYCLSEIPLKATKCAHCTSALTA